MKHKFFTPFLILILLFPFTKCALFAGDYNFLYSEENVLDFFNYDKTTPLDAKVDTMGSILIYHKLDLGFTSIHGERIPGKLWVPKTASADSPIACILWLHGYGGNKHIDDFAFGVLGPNLKCAFLALDAQYHGDRREHGKAMYSLDLLQDRYAIAQTIMDYRRALDVLEQFPTIDMNNIGLFGGSMGGILGGLLAGVDSRIKASVLIVGGGHWAEMMRLSDHSTAPALREYLKGQYRLADRLLEPVDPLRLIHRVKNVQMHSAEDDLTVPFVTSVELFEQAAEPKEFHTYPHLNHETLFLDPAVIDVVIRTFEWFKTYLDLPLE